MRRPVGKLGDSLHGAGPARTARRLLLEAAQPGHHLHANVLRPGEVHRQVPLGPGAAPPI
jgi:hypothetical protein